MKVWDQPTPVISPEDYQFQSLKKSSAIRPVEDLEDALCAYTGSPFAVAVSSCTIALEMVCAYHKVKEVTIPARTYASVPQAIIKAGGRVYFRNIAWRGAYQLSPYPIWDCAPRFTTAMYVPGAYQCLSFHRFKILGHTEGGAILLDNGEAANIFRIMRHDGRPPGSFMPVMIGYHAVMPNGVAAELLLKKAWRGPHEDMPFDDNYPNLSLMPWNEMAGGSEDPLYILRDKTNRLFCKAWRRLQELDPVMWKEYQQGISDNDRKITELMSK